MSGMQEHTFYFAGGLLYSVPMESKSDGLDSDGLDGDGLDRDDEEAYHRLRDIVHATDGAAVAFSGGVDSTFLLDVAGGVLGLRCMAITAFSPLYPLVEQEFAVRFAKKNRIKHIRIDGPSLSSPCFADNPRDRCYHCKKEIFTQAKKKASRYSMQLVDATNVDDLADYRPGLQAASELGVSSPLKEAGFDKARIRRLAKKRGLPNWDAPSQACLATRIPHGTPVTEELLGRIDRAERLMKDLGFSSVRVRCHAGIARIEIAPEEFEKIIKEYPRRKILSRLFEEGFDFVTVDLAGYKSGSMNPADT